MSVPFLSSRLTMPGMHGYLGELSRVTKIASVALSVLHILSGVWLGRPRLLSGIELGVAMSPLVIAFVVTRIFGRPGLSF
ncbi:MAG: hypothetical protein OXF02_01275 [Simkaniaceae bacterium]|nr:hypothetical protein [Simkaniaceae bacterium]